MVSSLDNLWRSCPLLHVHFFSVGGESIFLGIGNLLPDCNKFTFIFLIRLKVLDENNFLVHVFYRILLCFYIYCYSHLVTIVHCCVELLIFPFWYPLKCIFIYICWILQRFNSCSSFLHQVRDNLHRTTSSFVFLFLPTILASWITAFICWPKLRYLIEMNLNLTSLC